MHTQPWKPLGILVAMDFSPSAEAALRAALWQIYLSQETTQQLVRRAVGRGPHLQVSGPECLSNRELEIFRLIGEGLTTSQVAGRLRRSVSTVESHRQKIKDKLGLKTAGDLTRAAVQWVLENG